MRARGGVRRADAAGDVAIIVGTIGHSPTIDALVNAGRLDVGEIRGPWERFVVQSVDAPLPGVRRAIVIAGSDRRGTAFGALELSEQIGVSPWTWWADVPVARRDRLAIRPGRFVSRPPAVRYRGIFLNDEDWGLKPWAAQTFDPAFGNVGPRTYERIFELLLRLKGNYCWPAMHACSTEFGSVDANLRAADDWGIVMGASHCEPINRNNLWRDAAARGPWRYDTNRAGIVAYWREWAERRGAYEATWTLGLRGIHDAPMKFPAALPDQVRVVQQAFADQRELLARTVDADLSRVPQIYMPYKEALAQYRAGLRVPDDVTLVWCDDNFGYVRQLSDAVERKRSGSAGVYYHLSYLGRPKPYLWLNTSPPALIWAEMSKALANGADRAWVLNVGDLKPGEVGLEFWLRMAWDPSRFDVADPQRTFLVDFAARQFGAERADAIANVLGDYYRLAAARKPELFEPETFHVVHYDEAMRGLDEWTSLRARADAVGDALPAEMRDAYAELVGVPVRIAAGVAERFIAADFNVLEARRGRAARANAWADRCDAAARAIDAEVARYNDAIAGGKWRGIMTPRGTDRARGLAWPTPVRLAASTTRPAIVVIDGQAASVGAIDAPPAVLIDAADATATGAWRVVEEDGERSPVADAGPASSRPAEADAVTLHFDVPDGDARPLRGFVRTLCPGDREDSFFYRIDDGPWRTWEDPRSRTGGYAWGATGETMLSPGRHALSLARRDPNVRVASFRFVDGFAAQGLAEQYATRSADVLRFDRAAGEDVTFAIESDDAPRAEVPWLAIERNGDDRWLARVDWPRVTTRPIAHGNVRVGEQTVRVDAIDHAFGGTVPWNGRRRERPFVEANGVVSIVAGHFARAIDAGGTTWRAVPGLGRSGHAIDAWPGDAASRAAGDGARVEYDVRLATTGPARLDVHCLPTHAVNAAHGVRVAASIDGGTAQVIDVQEDGGPAGEMSLRWAANATRNVTVGTAAFAIDRPGAHTVALHWIDPGVIVDRLVLDLGGAMPSEMGPPESRVTGD